jgi:hypothetical protein
MATPPTPEPRPELSRPGQKVRWRDPHQARAWGWADALGAGPFEVLRLVDRGEQGLPPGLVLHTALGEREVNAVWLEPAAGPGGDTGSREVEGAG